LAEGRQGLSNLGLFGAVAFINNGTFHGACPSVVMNMAGFLISAVALMRMRAADAPAAIVDAAQVQYPGARHDGPDGRRRGVFTRSLPAVPSLPAVADGQHLAQ
jgi:hypothetical protein